MEDDPAPTTCPAAYAPFVTLIRASVHELACITGCPLQGSQGLTFNSSLSSGVEGDRRMLSIRELHSVAAAMNVDDIELRAVSVLVRLKGLARHDIGSTGKKEGTYNCCSHDISRPKASSISATRRQPFHNYLGLQD